MESIRKRILFFLLLLMIFFPAFFLRRAEAQSRDPHIGFLYPAGAKQGTETRIVACGQYLRRPVAVYVSGKGVEVSVVSHIQPRTFINGDERRAIQEKLKAVWRMRCDELAGGGSAKTAETADTDADKLPAHPLLLDVEKQSMRDLLHTYSILFAPRWKQQRNRQLAEYALLKVTVAADAEPGDRELRLETRTGLTNPMVFQVGQLPEHREREPNDRQAHPPLSALPRFFRQPGMTKPPPPAKLTTPFVINGQILPGDIDRFTFLAESGENLVINVQARRLIPYLADAVPGWFQATVTLYNPRGEKVLFADDFRFHPDPVFRYKVPQSGEYTLKINDAVFRGREDFIYRISVGELPFVTELFPPGGRQGTKTRTSLKGWNLEQKGTTLNTAASDRMVRETRINTGTYVSNSFPYAVGTLSEALEKEPNNTKEKAQEVQTPCIINGRINEPGDADMFRFTGKAGATVVAEVMARQLNSPLDSLLRIIDGKGNIVKWNDDHAVNEGYLHKNSPGLLTHHADSFLTADLTETGTYYVQLTDSQDHGGDAYTYRLRISPPRPDFSLRVTPSSVLMRPGGVAPLCVHVLRKDGFEGPIQLTLGKRNRDQGFVLHGASIPPAAERMYFTLTAPAKAPKQPVALTLTGTARIDGTRTRRHAVPADNVMQAFLYRHLVPSKQLLVSVQNVKWRRPPASLVNKAPVAVPEDGEARVTIQTWKATYLKDLILRLVTPSEGLSIGSISVVPKGFSFLLKTTSRSVETGSRNNLIVELLRSQPIKGKNGKPTGKKQVVSMGYLPAIPIKVVKKQDAL